MNDVIEAAGREARRVAVGAGLARAVAIAALLLLLWPHYGAAQGLNDEAREVLREAQRLAAQAMTRYRDHYPDEPLWREAIELGQRAQRLAPERTEPYRFLGQVYSVTGWYSRAWDAWQRYRDLGGEIDAQARSQLLGAATWLGFNSFSSGDYRRAVPFLEEALRLNPEDRLTLFRLTQAHIELGEPAAARPYAESLVALDPGSSQLLERIDAYLEHGVEAVEAVREAQELYQAEQLAEALERFEVAIERSPEYLEALRGAGRAALAVDRPGQAVRYWERVIALDPEDSEATDALILARNRERFGTAAYAAYLEAVAARDRGRIELAAERYRQALEHNPTMAPAHAGLGQILFEEGDLEGARERFLAATRLEPDVSDYRFFLSATEEELRREAEAQAQEEEQRQAAQEARAQEQAAEAARAEAEARAQAEAEAEAEAQAQAEAEARARAEAEERAREAEQAAAQERAEEAAAAQEAAAQEAAAEEAAAQEAAAEEAAAAAAEAAAAEEQAAANAAAEGQQEDAPEPEPLAEAAAAPAPARQAEGSPALLVADVVVSHESAEAGGSGAFSFLPGGDLARDLGAPVNYATGTLYQRLEVRSKPSDVAVHYQLCLVPNDDISVQPACTAGDQLVFDGVGAYEAQQPVTTLSGYQGIDWGNGMESMILVIKDPSGVPVDSRYLLGDGAREPADPGLYYPMEVRYIAILVPDGGTFPGWPP